MVTYVPLIASYPHGQYGRHFADDIFRHIFVNEHIDILIEMSLNFVADGPIDNNPALVEIESVTLVEVESIKTTSMEDNGSVPIRRQTIIWTNVDPIHWQLYAALVGDD